jgi:hypothetical protein
LENRELTTGWVDPSGPGIDKLKEIYNKADCKLIGQTKFKLDDSVYSRHINIFNPELVSFLWKIGYLTIESSSKNFIKLIFFGPKISLIKTGAKKSTEAINELVQALIDRKIENVLIVLCKICKQSEGSKRINSEELFEWFLNLLLNLSDHKADVQTQVDRRPVISNIEFKYKYFIAII